MHPQGRRQAKQEWGVLGGKKFTAPLRIPSTKEGARGWTTAHRVSLPCVCRLNPPPSEHQDRQDVNTCWLAGLLCHRRETPWPGAGSHSRGAPAAAGAAGT